MKILLFGANGQVGRAVALAAAPGIQVVSLGRAQVDLACAGTCADAIAAHTPDAVINAAAYTAVDRAESEADLAFAINSRAVENMARECTRLGCPLVHISTDYVFSGAAEADAEVQAPYLPEARPDPLNVYGASKLAGERAVAQFGGVWAILRTSWVFAPEGNNFVNTMLRLGQSHERLRIVSDQCGGPTPAIAIAQACLALAQQLAVDPALGGVYHFSGAPDTTWAGFAREIFAQAGMDVVVEEIPTSAYPTPAPRPLDTRLNCDKLLNALGLARPDWRVALSGMLASRPLPHAPTRQTAQHETTAKE